MYREKTMRAVWLLYKFTLAFHNNREKVQKSFYTSFKLTVVTARPKLEIRLYRAVNALECPDGVAITRGQLWV